GLTEQQRPQPNEEARSTTSSSIEIHASGHAEVTALLGRQQIAAEVVRGRYGLRNWIGAAEGRIYLAEIFRGIDLVAGQIQTVIDDGTPSHRGSDTDAGQLRRQDRFRIMRGGHRDRSPPRKHLTLDARPVLPAVAVLVADLRRGFCDGVPGAELLGQSGPE